MATAALQAERFEIPDDIWEAQAFFEEKGWSDGLPIIPPVYSLRVLPYALPHIATWKRRVLREREFSDGEEFHLHGV